MCYPLFTEAVWLYFQAELHQKIHICLIFCEIAIKALNCSVKLMLLSINIGLFATLSLFGSTVIHQRKFCLQYKYVFQKYSHGGESLQWLTLSAVYNAKQKTDGWVHNTLSLFFLFFSVRSGMTTSCDGCQQSLTGLSSLEFHRTRSGDPTLCSTTSETVTIINIIVSLFSLIAIIRD